MSQNEIQIPLDVVLDISAILDLQHSLRLLATCKNYRSLSSSKAFWLGALKRITEVHRRPLPCPNATDLSTIALDKLREMAIRAYRLMQNWSAENPTPVSTRTFQIPSSDHRELRDDGGLRLIPGTHLMINVAMRCDIFCWDTMAGTCLGSITSPSSRYITIGSNSLELPGQCFFGVGYDFDLHFELAVICIDYSDSANVTISKTHSYEWAIPDPDKPHACIDVALDGNQIGMIVAEDGLRMPLAMVYCKHHDKMIHCINTRLFRGIFDSGSPPCCLIHDDQFYIASQNKLAMDIYHVRTDSSSLQAMPSLPSSICKVAQAAHSHEPRLPYQLRFPRYDVFAVTQGSLLPDVMTATPNDRVYFWPVIDTGGAELTLGPTYSYEHNCQIDDMCASASGRSAVIRYKSSQLGLIQYVAHPTPHTTFRLLDIPSDIAESCASFDLDDSLGVLCLRIPQDGTVAVCSFV